jgi:hypothetical protein
MGFEGFVAKNHQERPLKPILGHFSIKKGGLSSNYLDPTP